ncbi:MAG: RIP metalloprotease RseP [Oleibacter sp.]|nr:RIP metalloprotease RseP [Thalassolituus sp.]
MTILYFIIAISLLVVIHEYGHFWVARRCGVQVQRFSVGFGKPLFSIKDRHGTEFSLAPIPLGGYVKMLDSREGPVPEHLKDQEFNSKPAWQKIAIAAAGPVANFIFAIGVYWAVFSGGTEGLIPVVGDVISDSPAAMAGIEKGDRIVSIDGEVSNTWQDVSWQLLDYLGETTKVSLTLSNAENATRQVELNLVEWLSASEQPDPLGGIGLIPRLPSLSLTIADVVADSPAQQAGMIAGDRIVAVNGEQMDDWNTWVDRVRSAPNQPLQVAVERNQRETILTLIPAAVAMDDGKLVGQVGVMAQRPNIPQDWLVTSQPGIAQAFVMGVDKTGQLIGFTLESLWKMITGDVSVKNLSGPITIAKVAGASASGGLETFVGFLALLSVSLGVLNLLPVPMLDGGHIVFHLIEMVRGKALPESVQVGAVKVGMLMLLMLMSVAFYNDISRL